MLLSRPLAHRAREAWQRCQQVRRGGKGGRCVQCRVHTCSASAPFSPQCEHCSESCRVGENSPVCPAPFPRSQCVWLSVFVQHLGNSISAESLQPSLALERSCKTSCGHLLLLQNTVPFSLADDRDRLALHRAARLVEDAGRCNCDWGWGSSVH